MDDHARKDVVNCICSILTSNPIRMTVQDLNKDFRKMIGYPVPYRKLGFNELDDYLRSIPDRVQVIGSGYFAEVRVVVNNKTAHINDLICKQKVAKNTRVSQHGLRKYVTPRMPPQHQYQNRWNGYSKPQQTSTPEKVPPAVVEKQLPTDDDDDDAAVPFIVRRNMKDLVVEYPSGVLCSRIPELFRRKYNCTLDYYQYGYRSVAQLCLDMPSTFKYQKCENGDVRIFDSSISMPESPIPPEPSTSRPTKVKTSEKKNTEPALPSNIEDILLDFHKGKMPKDCVIDGNIERQWIGPEVKVLDFVDVVVADVYDPSKFWIHLKEYSDELNELMDNMQLFYRTRKTQYEVPHYAFKTDMLIACMYSKEYHRARILDVSRKMQSLLKVIFIDYGTVATVYTTGVLYLDKAFVDLPGQAIRARLHGIQPVVKDEFWPREAAIRLLALVKRKEHLVAQIMWIDNVEQTLDIVLADTSVPDEDFYINDALVAEGYAKFLDEAQEEPKPKDYVPSVQCIYLFPTHGEIEAGTAPTLYLMIILEQTNVTIDSIFPQYFSKISEAVSNQSHDFTFTSQDDVTPKELSWADKCDLEEIESSKRASTTRSTTPITEENMSITSENITPKIPESVTNEPTRPLRHPPGFPAISPPYPMQYPLGFAPPVDPRLLVLYANMQYRNLIAHHRLSLSPFNEFSPRINPNYMPHFHQNAHFPNIPPPPFYPQCMPPENHNFFNNAYHNAPRNMGYLNSQNFPHQYIPPFPTRPENLNFCHNPNNDKTEMTPEDEPKRSADDTTTRSVINDNPPPDEIQTESPELPINIRINKTTEEKNLKIDGSEMETGSPDEEHVPPTPEEDYNANYKIDKPNLSDGSLPENYGSKSVNIVYIDYSEHTSENDEEAFQDECSTGRCYGSDYNKHNRLVEVITVGELDMHIINFRNSRFFFIGQLLETLFGAVIPTHMIRRLFNSSPPFINILSITLKENAELADELLRYKLIKEDCESIDIVSIDDSQHVVAVLRGASDNRKCHTFLTNIKTIIT